MATCKKYGAKYDGAYGVCPKCGTPMPKTDQAPYSYATPALLSEAAESEATVAPKKTNGKLIAAISISDVVLIGVIILVTMLFIHDSGNTNFDEQLLLGEKYLTEENYDEAIAAFKKAIEIDSYNEDSYLRKH